ncbi:MAG: MATE family efflux transporter [Pseudomonadota bacterium]
MTARADHPVARPSPGALYVLALAWPMTLKAAFPLGMVVIDGWPVSALGEAALAALGLAAALGGIVLGVNFAFSHAMQIRTARAFGTGDPRKCSQPASSLEGPKIRKDVRNLYRICTRFPPFQQNAA